LAGTGTDPDGTISSYQWTKISGGNATLSGATTATLSLTGLVAGTYVFRLTVIDNKQASHSDDVEVIVKTVTKAPVADAGGDKTFILPVSSVTLYGSASTELGTITSYHWELVNGAPVTIQNPDAQNLVITDVTTAGTRIFKLTVRNSGNYTDYSQARVVFKTAGTAARSSEGEPTEINGIEAPAKFEVTGSNPCDGCTVVVFNESQETIYKGPWKTDSYQEVFDKAGLYIYHVIRKNKTIDSGKIFRQ